LDTPSYILRKCDKGHILSNGNSKSKSGSQKLEAS